MGKTTRWLRGLFGGKKSTSEAKPATEKRRWAFLKMSAHADKAVRSSDERKASSREEGSFPGNKAVRSSAGDERKASNREEGLSNVEGTEQNKHAIAVAEATAAVAEAAVAAAQAAAEVVRLTSTGTAVRRSGARREDWAAVKIQAAFRGYLARRALKALKGLVKLQALVRGYFVRKQAVNKLRYMEAVVNVQTRIRGGRTKISENHQLHKVLQQCPGPATPEKYESAIRTSRAKQDHLSILNRSTSRSKKTDYAKNWLDQWMNEHPWDHHHQTPTKSGRLDDEKNDKILEVDPGKPRLNPKCLNCIPQQISNSTFNRQSFATFLDSPSKDSTTAQHSHPSPSVAEMQSLSPLRFPMDVEDSVFCTADNSPELYSTTSSRRGGVKRGLFTPTKSDCTRSFLSGYSDYPSYMANTESSRAKVRSQSAPRQRPEFDKSTSTKRLSVHGFGEGKSNRSSSSLHVKFTSKAYPGSGRLDRLGMPIC